MNTGRIWKDDEIRQLLTEYPQKRSDVSDTKWCADWGSKRGFSAEAVRGQLNRARREGEALRRIAPSPYPSYNAPLAMEGDALILPDIELPFHNAGFLNRVLDLTDAWGVKQCILAGDALHFDSLSGWEPSWTAPNDGCLTADAEATLMQFAKSLPSKKQGELMTTIGNLGQRNEKDGMSTEMGIARRELCHLAIMFERVDFILGNHEGRLLRALQTALDPKELLRLLEAGDHWRIAPYYFQYLDTSAGRYLIEHPKGAAEGTAQGLAAKYGCHVIMGHSHALDFSWDISGRYYAIQAGHCVDEIKLPYAAQRHTTKRMHKPGAVIVLDGYPYLLHEGTDWRRMKKIV